MTSRLEGAPGSHSQGDFCERGSEPSFFLKPILVIALLLALCPSALAYVEGFEGTGEPAGFDHDEGADPGTIDWDNTAQKYNGSESAKANDVKYYYKNDEPGTYKVEGLFRSSSAGAPLYAIYDDDHNRMTMVNSGVLRVRCGNQESDGPAGSHKADVWYRAIMIINLTNSSCYGEWSYASNNTVVHSYSYPITQHGNGNFTRSTQAYDFWIDDFKVTNGTKAAGPANNAPVGVNVSGSPTDPMANQSIVGWSNFTDANLDTLSVNCTWYKNGTHTTTRTLGSLTQGILYNILNLTDENYSAGDELTYSCYANDGTVDGSVKNSSVYTVQSLPVNATAPVMTVVSGSPTSPHAGQDIVGWSTATDVNGGNIDLNCTWYKNGTHTATRTLTSLAEGASYNILNFSNGNYSAGDELTYSCYAYDGALTSSVLNSSVYTVVSTPIWDFYTSAEHYFEGSNSTDLLGNQNVTTLGSFAFNSTGCKSNGCFNYLGAGGSAVAYLNISDSSTWDSVSIVFWVRVDTVNYASAQYPVGIRADGDHYFLMKIEKSGDPDPYKMGLKNRNNTDPGGIITYLYEPNNIIVDQWEHYVYNLHSNRSCELLKNGVQVIFDPTCAKMNEQPLQTYIDFGNYGNVGALKALQGYTDEMIVYKNRTMNSSEAVELASRSSYLDIFDIGTPWTNTAPVVTNASLLPTVLRNNITTQGWCTFTDVDANASSLNMTFYKNNTHVATRTLTGLAHNISYNVLNLSHGNYSDGDLIKISCVADDGLTSNVLNSTIQAVTTYHTVTAPVINAVDFSPLVLRPNITAIGSCSFTDNENNLSSINMTWYKNGTYVASRLLTGLSPSTSYNVLNLSHGNYSADDNIKFSCLANDGLASAMVNSTEKTVQAYNTGGSYTGGNPTEDPDDGGGGCFIDAVPAVEEETTIECAVGEELGQYVFTVENTGSETESYEIVATTESCSVYPQLFSVIPGATQDVVLEACACPINGEESLTDIIVRKDNSCAETFTVTTAKPGFLQRLFGDSFKLGDFEIFFGAALVTIFSLITIVGMAIWRR